MLSMFFPTSSSSHLLNSNIFHISSVEEVFEWQPRSLEDIIAVHGEVICDGPILEEAICLDLEDLQDLRLLDDDGREIPLYNEEGYQIERRLATHLPNSQRHGILVNLRNLDDLFHSEEFIGDMEGKTSYYVYPLAGLVTAGHFQAKGLISAFRPLLQKLNEMVKVEATEDDSRSMDGNNANPIIGVGCQAYNALTHATRGRCAQHHDAQRGLVTATLAGAWAKTPSNIQKARSLRSQCRRQLPHMEFREKISRDGWHDPVDCSLRLENTFVVDMDLLAEGYRDGSYVILHFQFF